MSMEHRQNNDNHLLKSAIEQMVKLLLAGKLCFSDMAANYTTLPSKKGFIPFFKPASHRYIELVTLINGKAGLQLESETINLTSDKVWAILPHVAHCEGYTNTIATYSVLWAVILSRGVSFFISEHTGSKGRQTTQRYFIEFPQAQQLWDNGCDPDLSSDTVIQAKFFSNFFAACVEVINHTDNNSSSWSLAQEKLIEQVKDYIQQHYRENVTIADLAKFAGYTPNYLGAIFLKYTNQTIRQYLLTVRLKLAMALLKAGQHQIKEVAFLTGFNDPLYFSRLFGKHYKQPPSLFIKCRPK